MTGIEHKSHQMIIDIITEKQQFKDFYAGFRSNDPNAYEKILSKAKKNL